MSQKRQIVFDTETTGFSPKDGHRVIEIGCVELVGRRVTGREFHQYINPEREVDAGAFSVHGLSNQFLKDKPTFSQIAEAFLDFVSGAELIAHNASFDVGFVNAELARLSPTAGKIEAHCNVLDTLMIARRKHPGQRNSLDALCKRYAVDLSRREKHGALLDAHLLCHVYLALTSGQKSLLASTRQVDQVAVHEVVETECNEVMPTPLRLASDEELAQHQEMIQKIIQQAGACLWQDEVGRAS